MGNNIMVEEEYKLAILDYVKQIVNNRELLNDGKLLEEKGELTENLASFVQQKVMDDAKYIRGLLEIEEGNEFKQKIDELYEKYDVITSNDSFNTLNLEQVYSNIKTALDIKEVNDRYYEVLELREISKNAINSINGIDKYNIKLEQAKKEELFKIQEKLKTLLAEEKTDISAIHDGVNTYNKYATEIWDDYLTDINDINDNEFRWIVHNLRKGDLKGEFRDKYISTSLITNNTMGVYGELKYGLIIKPKHIVSASYKDTYTYNSEKDEKNLFLNKPPIMLPQEIEEKCINITVEENGEMLNYDKTSIYSELVADEFEIYGVYYISCGEHELAKDYEGAKRMADELGVPLRERDISKYRSEHGLEPLTKKSQKDLCRHLLHRCCMGDKILEEMYEHHAYDFVDKHSESFYERYKIIRENPAYSTDDILKAFVEEASKEYEFSKISENVYQNDQKESIQNDSEYGLSNITDEKTLKTKLEKVVSLGIHYGANIENEKGMQKFAEIEKEVPQYEQLKTVYLKLRTLDIEDKLYESLDFNSLCYDEIISTAERILEEHEKGKEKKWEDRFEKWSKEADEISLKTQENIGDKTKSVNEPRKDTIEESR